MSVNVGLMDFVVADAGKKLRLELAKVGKTTKAPIWTRQEDQFLTDNLGVLSEEEIAAYLGRTVVAVHLHWDRDLRLPAPSKAPGIITAHRAAYILGVDSHKTAHWVDKGFIPGRLMAGGRKIRLIEYEAFKRWAVNPLNWMYFDIRQVKDEKLKRLLALRSKRWGDEWWTTPMVAKYHGVETGDVKRMINLGKIKATQISISYGGRHPDMSWALWFVLKSEATRLDLRFDRRGKGMPNIPRIFTPRALKWIVKAHDKKKMNFTDIARTMKMKEKRAGIIKKWYCKAKGISTKTRFSDRRVKGRKK